MNRMISTFWYASVQHDIAKNYHISSGDKPVVSLFLWSNLQALRCQHDLQEERGRRRIPLSIAAGATVAAKEQVVVKQQVA